MKDGTHSKQVRMMGTVIDLVVNHENSEKVLEELIRRLRIYELRFSANDERSELMKVNHAAGKQAVVVHPDLFKLIEIGKKESLVEDSLLNITIGPLVQMWRIGFSDAKIPRDDRIKECLNLIDPAKIQLDESKHSVFLEEEGMLIDLGALAKGYIADLLMDYLKSQGVKSAMINLGGNIVVLGASKKSKQSGWRIGIRNPNFRVKENRACLNITNQSVVTSGIYERSIEYGGKSYHHILDSQTGYPVETDMASLTIVSDASLDGEIWTTYLFGKQSYEALEIINKLKGIECLIINNSGDVLMSELLKTQT